MNLLKLQFLTLFFALFTFLSLQAQCPSIEFIMVHACNPAETGINDEFVIISSNANEIPVDEIFLKFPFSIPGNHDHISVNSDCFFMMPPLNASLAGCPNVIPVGPGDIIPSNKLIVIITNASGDASGYDWTPLCGTGETIYLLQNNCARTAGCFADNTSGSIRTTVFSTN